jgi:polyisoprenoid-binding protein YceI
VVPDRSKATFRVREQLGRLPAPSDAVGSTGKVTGQLVVASDGTFVPGQSKVSVDMTDLRTDDQLRDGLIKRTTLQTDRFPTAEFVPTSATGLPNPLPDSGEYTFQLVGQTTIHGVQRETTWDVTAKRDGTALTGSATTSFQFGDFGMQRPQAPVVLSIVDEIRLEVQLVANQV